MWTYHQLTGQLFHDGELVATGYAGHDDGDGIPEPGEGRNDPSKESVRNVGPLPRGLYTVGAPEHTTHGPYVLWLHPDPSNEMFGRNGFLVHGDSISTPGAASLGCICVARAARVKIWESGDHRLEVVA